MRVSHRGGKQSETQETTLSVLSWSPPRSEGRKGAYSRAILALLRSPKCFAMDSTLLRNEPLLDRYAFLIENRVLAHLVAQIYPYRPA